MEIAAIETCDRRTDAEPVALPAPRRRMRLHSGALIGTMALVDQAVFSGTSFLTTIIVGRASTRHELGTYSLGFTIILGILCVQESLISLPYIIYGNRLQGTRRAEYAGSVLIHYGLLSALAIVGLAITALALSLGVGPPDLPAVIAAIACVIPWILLRQFGRRFAFAHLHIVRALAIDVAVAALQIGGLCYLAATGRLTAVAAYVVMGTACAVAAVGWLVSARASFVVRKTQVSDALRRNWSFGRWVFASEIASISHVYSLHWLLALVLSTAATGIFTACETVAAFSNPLVLGIGNVLAPWSARAFAEGGPAAVRRVIRRATLVLAAMMIVFFSVLALWGGQIVALLFGSEFAGNGHVVAVLGLSSLVAALGIPAGDGLRAMERPDVNFVASLMGFFVALVGAAVLIVPCKVPGVAYGLLAGTAVASTARCIMAFRIAAPQPEPHQTDDWQSWSGVSLDASCNPVTVCEQLQTQFPPAQPPIDRPRTWAAGDAAREEMHS